MIRYIGLVSYIVCTPKKMLMRYQVESFGSEDVRQIQLAFNERGLR